MLESGVYKKGKLDLLSLFGELLSGGLPRDVGAVVTFLGVTREIGQGEKRVTRLEMETYEEHADKMIVRLCDEVKEKYGLALVKVYHFVGEFEVGEPVVFVVAAGRSRDQAFSGLQEAVKRYKTEPALWKREVYVDGSHQWISNA